MVLSARTPLPRVWAQVLVETKLLEGKRSVGDPNAPLISIPVTTDS